MLALDIDMAARYWRDIPAHSLREAVEAAIVRAAPWAATIPQVAQLWQDRKAVPKMLDHAAVGNRDRISRDRQLPSPETRLPTEQEREANAAMFQRLAEGLRK